MTVPRSLLALSSLKSSHHWNQGGLACLNPDKIYTPIQESGGEYGNTAQQKHFQQIEQ